MKSRFLLLISLLLCNTYAVAADADSALVPTTPLDTSGTDATKAPAGQAAEYLLHLGAFLGYTLTDSGAPSSGAPSDKLINAISTQLAENYAYNTAVGAIPVNTAGGGFTQFVPTSNPTYSALNSFANYTFSNPPYNNATSQGQGTVAVSHLIDQQTYQQDPVSQAVLDILGTPDISFYNNYCMQANGVTPQGKCDFLYQYQVMNNVIGKVPDAKTVFRWDYNQQYLSQLNGNTLIAPLMYSTQNNSSSTSSAPPSQGENAGLTATTQAQEAANFIRYAIANVMPMTTATFQQYNTAFAKLVTKPRTPSELKAQQNATSKLVTYLTSLRVYAAQMSVGIGNLYAIFSKRMPQNQSAKGSNMSSQALSEFTMATWRLYNPDQSANQQWVAQMNQASAATVQKEIATLLAEINYQLYLTRQQEERILLTNTMILIQNSHSGQPDATQLNLAATTN